MIHFFSNVRQIKGLHAVKLISEKQKIKTGGGGKPSKGDNGI